MGWAERAGRLPRNPWCTRKLGPSAKFARYDSCTVENLGRTLLLSQPTCGLNCNSKSTGEPTTCHILCQHVKTQAVNSLRVRRGPLGQAPFDGTEPVRWDAS